MYVPSVPLWNSYISIHFGIKNIIFTKSHDNYHGEPLEISQTVWNNPIWYRFTAYYQMLSPLWKLLVIIMRMTHELQMRATGTIFIVEIWNFQTLFLIGDTITIFKNNFKKL